MGLKFKIWIEFLLLFPSGKNVLPHCLIGEATLTTLSFNVCFIFILKAGTVISQCGTMAYTLSVVFYINTGKRTVLLRCVMKLQNTNSF